MGIGKESTELSFKIEYSFHDITILQTALTHASYTHELKAKGIRSESNESLEFLGDAVLQTVISDYLYTRFSKQGEGALTRFRQRIVCESTLAGIARSLSVGDYLNVGTGEEHIGIRSSEKVLADAMEAIIAAIYIDDRKKTGGDLYTSVILKLFSTELNSLVNFKNTDYKTALQEFVEKNSGDILSYDITETGPEHKKTFCAVAYINNNKVGEGRGRTKRTAEMQAAKDALHLFGFL